MPENPLFSTIWYGHRNFVESVGYGARKKLQFVGDGKSLRLDSEQQVALHGGLPLPLSVAGRKRQGEIKKKGSVSPSPVAVSLPYTFMSGPHGSPCGR